MSKFGERLVDSRETTRGIPVRPVSLKKNKTIFVGVVRIRYERTKCSLVLMTPYFFVGLYYKIE